LRDNKEYKLFDEVSSRRYAKDYLKGITGRLQTVRIYPPGRSVQYRTSELSIRLRNSPVKKTDAEILRTDRTPQEKKLLRKMQEPEHGTEKITSLVYVV
jgi:hypothetical protein